MEQWWRGDMFCGQCWFFPPRPQFSPSLIRPRWLASLELSLASGRCDTEHVRARERVCCLSGESAAERKLYTHRARETSVCLQRWTCLPLCGHTRRGKRGRESCVSPWEIKSRHGIQRKSLISPFDKKQIESLFRSQPPTEKTAGECYTRVSQHRFRSVSPHANMPIAIISCHLQSTISTHNTNPPWQNLNNFITRTLGWSRHFC